MTLTAWEAAARLFEKHEPRWKTPGDLAAHLNPKTRRTPALDLIDEHLIRAFNTPDSRLIISMPPQEGKSVRAAGDFPTWALTQNPDLRVVTASYGQQLANRNGRAVRNRIAHNDLGISIAPDNGSVHEWQLAGHDGGVLSVGVGAGVTGRPADCITGDMLIECEHGGITAEHAFRIRIKRIRAYDHTAGRIVWRDVEAARRISGRRVVEIRTESGRVLTCTPDHRVYTGRGYLPARDLRSGDSLLAVMGDDAVRVRCGVAGAEAGSPEGNRPGTAPVLLNRVRADRHRDDAAKAAVRGVRWAGPEERADHLRGGVLGGKVRGEARGSRLPALRADVPTDQQQEHVLLTGLRESGALDTDDRREQLALQGRHQLRQVVPADASADTGAGRRRVRRVLEISDHSVHPEREADAEVRVGDSSSEREAVGQSGREPNHPLLEVSRGTSQISGDTVSVVRELGDGEVDVYDFQVAGTHNFFANGVLVHNCMIIDDPVKDRAEADSPLMRDRVWDWWTDAASARLAPGAPVIVILTRWHHDDLAGRLMDRDKDAGWVYLNIPAQADHRPEQGETDPLGRAPGEFMVSARGRSTAQWERRKATAGPRTWASLYQGRPTPDEGGIFPHEWPRFTAPLWEERPDGTRIVPQLGRENTELIQSWDLAFKDSTGSDYVVGQVWLRDGADAYLLDMTRARLSFTATLDAIRAMSARWPQALAKLVEDKANGPAVINTLKRTLPGLIAVEPEGSKTARANSVSYLAHAANVHLPTAELLPNVEELVEEARGFPAGKHDDAVDAMTQALNQLYHHPLGESGVVVEPDMYDDVGWSISPY